MACAKRNQSGSCSHFQCPYADKTEHGYDCVDLITTDFGRICELGAGCVPECPYSYEPGDVDAENVVRTSFNNYIADQLAEHGNATQEEIDKAREAEEFDRELDAELENERRANEVVGRMRDAYNEAKKEREEMEKMDIVSQFIHANPIAAMQGALDILYAHYEMHGTLPGAASIEHVENIKHNVDHLVESMREDIEEGRRQAEHNAKVRAEELQKGAPRRKKKC